MDIPLNSQVWSPEENRETLNPSVTVEWGGVRKTTRVRSLISSALLIVYSWELSRRAQSNVSPMQLIQKPGTF